MPDPSRTLPTIERASVVSLGPDDVLFLEITGPAEAPVIPWTDEMMAETREKLNEVFGRKIKFILTKHLRPVVVKAGAREIAAEDPAHLLASGPPINSIRQAVGEANFNFYAEVGVQGVARIEVVQEYGAGGRETGDVWLVVFDDEGPRFRVLASHAIVGYRPRLTGTPEVPPPFPPNIDV